LKKQVTQNRFETCFPVGLARVIYQTIQEFLIGTEQHIKFRQLDFFLSQKFCQPHKRRPIIFMNEINQSISPVEQYCFIWKTHHFISSFLTGFSINIKK